MTFSERPLVQDIKTGNGNSVDLMSEYNLTRSELTYLCEKFQHEGQISAEDLNRVLLGLDEPKGVNQYNELPQSIHDHNTAVDDKEKRRKSDNAGWGDSLFSFTDIGSGLGRSTANASSAGMMAVSASALDTAVGTEVAEAAGSVVDVGAGVAETAGSVVDVGAGVAEAAGGIAEAGLEVAGDVIGGVVEIIGAVLGGILDAD